MGDSFMCETGVRQGESLSSFLFACLIHDFEEYILDNSRCKPLKWNELKLLLAAFADDCAVLAESEEELADAMRAAQDYCDTWGMKINYDKIKCMVFSGGHRKVDINLEIGGHKIEQVDYFTYLGTTFYTNANWRRTQLRVSKQAEKAIFSMRALQRRFHQNPVDKSLDFQCLVEPVLTYACQAWGVHRCNDVITTYNRYYKRLLALKPSTPEYM